MKKLSVLALLLILAATSAVAHAGHMHTYMGSVTMLHGEGAFMMKTIEGKEITVLTSKATAWLQADDRGAKRSDLAVGSRVVVKMSTDGKTAASVKMAPAASAK